MFTFFLPVTKIQKDRLVMRHTDARLAKYSRRGIIANFIAFLVILLSGKFYEENRNIMIVLTVGLALTSLLRGWFLFRFDHIYPRAPSQWRNRYFMATILSGIWWGIILSVVTLELRMEHEAPLLWIYTVIFFSINAHAFAPYQRFLSYYQFFGLIPAALVAMSLGDFTALMFGIMTIIFYMVLTHQCRLISENYWERLEATYVLARKTQSMEAEKRDTRANVKLYQEFTYLLHADISQLLSHVRQDKDIAKNPVHRKIRLELNELSDNVRDFHGVLSKELNLETKIFNVRHEIQHVVAEFIDNAERNDVQIETSLSPNLPLRLKGDASRIAQVIRTMMEIALEEAIKCVVLVEVEFLREYENAGELYVTVTRTQQEKANPALLVNPDEDEKPPRSSLALVVSKGLAELMNGSLEHVENTGDDQQYRFNAKVDVAEAAGQLDFHKDCFTGRNVLLVHNSPRIVDIKRQELDALGFSVHTETQYARALTTLTESYQSERPIESVLFYLEPDKQHVVDFCEAVLAAPELKYANKIMASTRIQQQVMHNNGYDEANNFYYVDKPTGLFELESVFNKIYKLKDNSDIGGVLKPVIQTVNVAVLTCDSEVDPALQAAVESLGENAQLIFDASVFKNGLADNQFQLLLIDCDKEDDGSLEAIVSDIRAAEILAANDVFIPIIGLSVTEKEVESRAYELGLDDFVDLIHNPKKTVPATVAYWSSLL